MPTPSSRRVVSRMCSLSACLLLAAACPAPAADDLATTTPWRVRLEITHAGVTTQELPALGITALGDPAWAACPVAASDRASDACWGGVWPADLQASALVPSPQATPYRMPRAVDNLPTTVLLSGVGELRPREVFRSGNRFTILCDGISGGGGDPSAEVCGLPKPQRELIALSLGVLPAGSYQCTLAITWRTPTPHSATILQFARTLGGTISFAVADHRGTTIDAAPAPEVLTDAELSTPDSALVARLPWVAPRLCQYRLRGSVASGLWEVAAIDRTRLGAEPLAPPPQGVDQPGGAMSAVIIGPLLNSGETVTLREIVLEQGAYRVTLESWTDDSPRLRNVPQQTLLVVPLPWTPGAARPQVVLDWRDLHAATTGGCYRERGFGQPAPVAASHLMICRDPIALPPPAVAPSAPTPVPPPSPVVPSHPPTIGF